LLHLGFSLDEIRACLDRIAFAPGSAEMALYKRVKAAREA
jgi:hypothetical protein